MPIILHGENIVASRERLIQLIKLAKKQGVRDIIRLNGTKIIQGELIQSIESGSLFGTDKLVVIERLLSRPVSKEKNQLISYLGRLDANENLILWEEKSIAAGTLNKLKNFTFEVFKISPVIFKFLDSVRPKNATEILNYKQAATALDAPELVFYLLARRITDLIIAKDKPNQLKNSPWQKTRLISQASNFTLDKLLDFHHQLLVLDESQKTGTAILPLTSQLDLTLASL